VELHVTPIAATTEHDEIFGALFPAEPRVGFVVHMRGGVGFDYAHTIEGRPGDQVPALLTAKINARDLRIAHRFP
jgi:hypothetical protein